MFEDRKTRSGVKIILPHLEPRPVSQQLPKRPVRYPKRPHTVDPIDHRKPLDRLKSLMKLKKLYKTQLRQFDP